MKSVTYYWVAAIVVIALGALLLVSWQVESEPPADDQVVAVKAQSQTGTMNASSGAVGAAPSLSPTAGAQAAPVQNLSAEDLAQAEERLDVMQQRRPERNFDLTEVAAALKRETAWSPAEEVPDNLPLEPEELTDGRQFIQLDSLKIETLAPGDEVKVFIEETGQEYQVTMDSVEKHDYDSISWHGHIDGSDGQTYSVSFTRGKELTVGGLDTPDGHYVLQAHGDNGWLASSDLLFKVADPSASDAIDPRDHGYSGDGSDSHQHDDHVH
jgi:hypothetical protein